MNLSSMFSRALRLWCTRRDCGRWERGAVTVGGPHSAPPITPSQEGLAHPDSVRTSPSLLSPSPPLLKQAGGQGRPAAQLPQGPWGSHSPAHHLALTFLSVMTLFLVPAMQPFSMMKSLLTSP